jgi:hypothetical protein
MFKIDTLPKYLLKKCPPERGLGAKKAVVSEGRPSLMKGTINAPLSYYRLSGIYEYRCFR